MRNEAAERLRERFHINAWDEIEQQFDEALATADVDEEGRDE